MNSPDTLVFGRNGQLARSLQEVWPAATFVSVDFADDRALAAVLDGHRPRRIVNAAAYTNVDLAESEADLAMRINAQAPGTIARWCAERSARLVHVSTDYVFDGSGNRPWREDDAPNPLNSYGRSKRAGEVAVLAQGHVVVRTSWLYSIWGKNFLKTMLTLGAERETLRVVDDQFGAPTYAPDLARALDGLMQHPGFAQASGVYHLTNAGHTSWCGFARAIFQRRPGRVREIVPLTSEEFASPARRPRNSRLDNQRVEHEFGIRMRAWDAALEEGLTRLP